MAVEKGYRANPDEAVTDLRIDGLRLLKVLVPIPVVIVLVVAFEPLLRHGWVFAGLLFAVIILDNTVFELLVREWARRRGRVDDRRALDVAGRDVRALLAGRPDRCPARFQSPVLAELDRSRRPCRRDRLDRRTHMEVGPPTSALERRFRPHETRRGPRTSSHARAGRGEGPTMRNPSRGSALAKS